MKHSTPNRNAAPSVSLPEKLSLPHYQTFSGANSVKLYSMQAGESPVVRLSVVFHGGSSHQSHPFAASSTINMLSEGTQKYSSAEISEILDFYGIFYDTSIDRDYSIVTINALEKFLPKALELLEELIIRPIFDERELEIYKSKRKEQLKIEREKSAYLARELFSKSLFGKHHPYGTISEGSQYDTLTTKHLKEFFTENYCAQRAFAVCSGSISESSSKAILSTLEKLPQGSPQVEVPNPELETTLRAHIEREGALQSSIRIGLPLFKKGDPLYDQMQVVAMILGGYFGSRLVQNLRETKGYTYGIYAAMVSMERLGYFAIATDVTAEHTEDAIEEIFYEIERLGREPITEQELEVVRSMIVGEVMRILDGPFGVADILIDNIQAGVDKEYLENFLDLVRNITPERISELTCKYLPREKMVVVTVGASGSDL